MQQINKNLKNKCGIYIITNVINGKRYIGSSKNIYERLRQHIRDLKNNRHINQYFQNSWNKYNAESFEFGILCICSEEELISKEQYFIDMITPEYNLDLDVKRTIRSDSTKEKISNTIQLKYNEGWTNATYKDPVYIYNINTWKLEKECSHFSEAGNYLYDKCGSLKAYQIDNSIIKNSFVVLSKKYSLTDLKNFVSENILKYKTQNGRLCYLVIEDELGLHYFKTASSAVDYMKCSSATTLKRHMHNTIENPYIIPNTNFKMYILDKYIPIEDKASL